jgi:hypothetical protein
MQDFTMSKALAAFDLQTTLVFGGTLLAFFVPVIIYFPPAPVRISEALAQTHSKLGLDPQESNLPRPGEDARQDASPRIKSLMVYPVKSCRGTELSRSRVVPTGLEHDRIYTFARLRPGAGRDADAGGEPVWELVTLRQCPRMVHVSVDIWCPDPAKTRGRLTERGSDESFLVLRYPWRRPGLAGVVDWVGAKLGKGWRGVPEREVLLPVAAPSDEEVADRGYGLDLVHIWGDTVRAVNMERELPAELAGFLGLKDRLGLFRMGGGGSWREVYRNAPRRDEAGYQPIVAFQDAVSFPSYLFSMGLGDI